MTKIFRELSERSYRLIERERRYNIEPIPITQINITRLLYEVENDEMNQYLTEKVYMENFDLISNKILVCVFHFSWNEHGAIMICFYFTNSYMI